MANWLVQLSALRTRRRRHAIAATLALVALTGVAIAHFNGLRKPNKTSPALASSAPTLRPFSFPDQQGTVVDESSLNGHVWIADFIFTTCNSACPLITSRFVTLQRRLPDERLRFVSFSVDPEQDTQEALSRYAERWAARESRWHLLRPDRAGLASLVAGLGVALDREGGEIMHTNRLFLVSAGGTLVGSYDSADDSALNALASRARELLGAPGPNSGEVVAGNGAELFSSLGCAGCHADPQLAPPLGGLISTHVMLERQGSVLVSDAYLAESIANPAAKLVSGYPDSMPSYGALLSARQLQSLVDYVSSLPAQPPSASTEAASTQTDPVCAMSVRITQRTPSVAYAGSRYHFCSAACAQRFTADPQKYLAGARKRAAAP